NGAQACKVFWQVGSSATLGTNSTFKGNILALTSATLTTGANVEGRVLAQNGAVTLDTNTVTTATCVVPPVSAAAAEAAAAKLTGNSSSGSFAPLPLINVTKIPSPLALPGGKGTVTYTYVATNIGPIAMIGVWVKDDKCSTVNFVSGDSNNNSILDINEAWTYRCTKTVLKTETNTATAHGQAGGWDAYDSANATVVVGVALPPPLIHLVKIPSAFVLSASGGPITYSYKVTNPGTAPLSNVSVVDDKCPGLPGRVAGHPGDLNKNNLLESNETWSFTCQTYLSKTTTNIGTAEGHANGLTAIDFSPATVVVSAPGLPNTGIDPNGKNIPWNIIALTALAGVVMFLYATKKTQANR
ncbi:MAG: ice-binding family protein, partial [bacterium]|nr:ice-binding family protein [bacterium]